MTRRTVPPAAASLSGALKFLMGHAAADEARLHDFPERVHLELVVGDERERLVGGVQVDLGLRALEVVALADFLARLVERVVDFLEVNRGRDVERRGRWHAAYDI